MVRASKTTETEAEIEEVQEPEVVIETTTEGPLAEVETKPTLPEPVYKLTIVDSVVEKIAARAVARIDGIVAMKGNLFSTIQEGLGGSVHTKGVTADLLDDSSAHIELDVILEYGKSAVEIFSQVRDIVVGDLQTMTGLTVTELDVNVVDVMTKEEYNARKKGDDKKGKDGSRAGQTDDDLFPEERGRVTVVNMKD